jgi:uncharacterized protein YukE
MQRIRVTPDLLRDLGLRLQQAALELRSLEARIAGVYARLDWEGPEGVMLDGPVRQARGQALSLADQADGFARQLAAKAQAFEAADAEGANSLTEVANAWLAWQAAYRSFSLDDDAGIPADAPALDIQAEIVAPPVEEDDGTGGKLKTLEEGRPESRQ